MRENNLKFRKNIFIELSLLFFTFGVFMLRWLRSLYAKKQSVIGVNKEMRAFDKFIKVNNRRWQEIDKKRTIKDLSKVVLVEAIVPHSGYILINLVVARHAMAVYGLTGVGLLLGRDRKLEELFRSYGISEFIYLEDRKKDFFHIILYGFKAWNILRGIKTVEDFLNLKFKGIDLGKPVYDHYLRFTGQGTLDKIDWRVFSGLINGISYQNFLENVFSSGRFSVLIQSERQFIPGSIIFQSALKHKTETYFRGGGPTKFTLRRFSDLSETYINTHRYSTEVFNHVYNNYRKEAIIRGEEFIRNRFAGLSPVNDIPDAARAYSTDHKTIARKELCKCFGWDEKKPIAGIMVNTLTDGVFTNRWRIFRDNLMWLRNTLQAIYDIDYINWFVKAHPSDVRNKVKTSTKSEYKKWAADCTHIKFLPDNIGSSSLPSIVDVILTGHGSAGIEYSTFGIPCVIAGESLYSGLGFVHEPKTKKEFFNLLNNVHTLKHLSQEQVDRAKVFVYTYLILSRVKSSLIPVFNVYQDYDEDKLWQDAAELIAKFDPDTEKMQRMLKIQVRNKYRHMLNYDWIGLY